ncbi:MAG: hypothetical protein AAF310_03980 [Myxococcota bacterium]
MRIFAALCVVTASCAKDDPETKRWVTPLTLKDDKNSSTTLDSNDASRNLEMQNGTKQIKTIPYDCTKKNRAQAGECWGQCVVSSSNFSVCEAREVTSPCKGLSIDKCFRQSKGSRAQCFVDYRGRVPKKDLNDNNKPAQNDQVTHYAPKCVNLSSVPDCHMRPLKDIEDLCNKQANDQKKCEAVEANGEKICEFSPGQAESCTNIDTNQAALCARVGKAANGTNLGNAADGCDQIYIPNKDANGFLRPCVQAIAMPMRVCLAAAAAFPNTYCSEAYKAFSRIAGRQAIDANLPEKNHTYCEVATSIIGGNNALVHLSGVAICKYQEEKPASCTVKPASKWSKDPCWQLDQTACAKFGDVCQVDSAQQIPQELLQESQP